MSAVALEPDAGPWTCGSAFCSNTLRTPAGHTRGWCVPCARRWYRAGKPEDGPPPPQPPAPHGASSRRTVAERRQRFAELRAQGLSIHEAGRQLGVSAYVAEKDAKALAQGTRTTAADEVWKETVMPRIAPPPSDPDRWWHLAACRDMPLELFYGAEGDAHSSAREDAAKAVCARCPVRSDCLDSALELRDWGQGMGVKGGLTGEERHNEHRRRLKQARGVAA